MRARSNVPPRRSALEWFAALLLMLGTLAGVGRAQTPLPPPVPMPANVEVWVHPSDGFDGTLDRWIKPPGALANPPNLGTLPLGYRTKYISFANQTAADIPLGTSAVFFWSPFCGVHNIPTMSFIVLDLIDDECAALPCAHDYFNLQGVIVENQGGGSELLRGNMQGEYR